VFIPYDETALLRAPFVIDAGWRHRRAQKLDGVGPNIRVGPNHPGLAAARLPHPPAGRCLDINRPLSSKSRSHKTIHG